MRKMIIFLCLSVVFLSYCTSSMSVNITNPKPNVDMGKSDKILKLIYNEDILNEFYIKPQNGILGTNVKDWRNTLNNGFKNAYENVFNLNTVMNNAGFQFFIKKAVLEFIPAVIYGGVIAVRAKITFQIQLLDNKGNVLKKSTGTVISSTIGLMRGALITDWEIDASVENAVVLMYEKATTDLFSNMNELK